MNAETVIQNAIRLDLGKELDLALFRNNQGEATVFDASCAASGRPRHISYGLGDGSPDLVGMLTVRGFLQRRLGLVEERAFSRWFAIEVKTPGWKPRNQGDKDRLESQKAWLAMCQRRGGFGDFVSSVEMARAALTAARNGDYSLTTRIPGETWRPSW